MQTTHNAAGKLKQKQKHKNGDAKADEIDCG